MDIDLAFIQKGLVAYLILVGSISVHEWAHAFVADKCGDSLPRSMGRVTLNPMAHIDIVGTVILPLVMILLSPGFALFGWGKPVITNPKSYRNYVKGDILVSMAGPFSNILIALFVCLVGGVLGRFLPADLIFLAVWINVMLAVFNLIPIPPLDGSHVLRHLVGMGEEAYIAFSRWGFLILLVMINLGPVRWVIFQAVEWAYLHVLSVYGWARILIA